MIKTFISWLYLKVVYMPALKEKIEKQYPGAKVTCSHKTVEDPELEGRLMRQACFERERIPDDHLH